MFNQLLRVKARFHYHVECDWEFNLIQIGVSSRGESLVINKLIFCAGKCWNDCPEGNRNLHFILATLVFPDKVQVCRILLQNRVSVFEGEL